MKIEDQKRRIFHDQCGARVHDKVTDTKKIQRIKEDNQIEDQMKKDHFGINVEREYKINHGRKANQIRMSKLTGINAKRISHEQCGRRR